MIEEILRELLTEKLTDPVFLEKPAKPPQRFYVIEKTNGGREDMIDSAVIAIRSYAETLYQAAVLNERLKTIMFDLIENNAISSVELNSDYNYTDPNTKEYRYQSVFDIVFF